MQFIPFKGIKKVRVDISSSIPFSNLFTLTADSLVFVSVYNTNPSQNIGTQGKVYVDSNGTVVNTNRVVLWNSVVVNSTVTIGNASYGTFVPSGHTIKQELNWIGGTVRFDIYILELNTQLVSDV